MSSEQDPALAQVLQSTSDVLFPADAGEAKVDLYSVGLEGDTPLHVLLWRDDTEGALLLIAHGAPLDAIGDMGETPLHIAAGRKNERVVRALVAAGANGEIVSEFGQTPRQLGASVGWKWPHGA